jgi:hypothetical protein
VTVVDKNRAVVCCLLATSVIMLSEKEKIKRKMWREKLSLEGNVSCGVHLMNGLIETGVDVECLEMMPSWCGEVNCGNCGIV